MRYIVTSKENLKSLELIGSEVEAYKHKYISVFN